MLDQVRAARHLEIADAVSDPGGAVNDDRVGFAADTLWVLDGATDQCADKLLPGGSDAAWLADAFSTAFADLAPGHPGSLLALAEDATRRVSQAFDSARIKPAPLRGFRPSAAGLLLRLRDGTLEILSMGDCVLVIAKPGEPGVLCGVDPTRLGDRDAIARVTRHAEQHGLSWMAARESLHAKSSGGRARMNLPGGYSVFSLDMPPPDLVHHEHIAAPSGTRLLAMTDGFARLEESFSRYTHDELLNAAFGKGLPAMVEELRALEAADPDCANHPRMKPRDDASAILAQLL